MQSVYYFNQLVTSYNMSFVAQEGYTGQITLYLNSAPTMVNLTIVNQMNNYEIQVYNQTGQFYGSIQNTSQINVGTDNKILQLIGLAGGWYVVYHSL